MLLSTADLQALIGHHQTEDLVHIAALASQPATTCLLRSRLD